MGTIVSRFTKKKFLYAVPITLLREFFTPFADLFPFDLNMLTYDPLFLFLSNQGDDLPAELVMTLHEIAGLATDEGYDLLISQAKEMEIAIVYEDEACWMSGELTHQAMAMLCYLRYNAIYLVAQHSYLVAKVRCISEFNGVAPIDYEEIEVRELNFKTEVEKYFEERYKGRFCQVDRFEENGCIHFSIAHGKHKSSLRVIEDSFVKTTTLREEKQDYLSYHPLSGKCCVSAVSAVERVHLAKLFAKEILFVPDYFEHQDSQNNYTIAPLVKHGLDFLFEHSWDPDVVSMAITEIKLAEVRKNSQTVTFSSANVLEQLRKHREIDIRSDTIVTIKIRFVFNWNGKKKSRSILIKPPSIAQFDRRLFGDRILEHLRRNGFVYERNTR